MATIRRYRTIQGDRWDNISSQFRNNPYDYVDIIQANPSYQGYFVLPAGITLSVPIKEPVRTKILPPWKK